MTNEPKKANRYTAIIEEIFNSHYKAGATFVEFSRDELTSTAARLGIPLPKNLGDVLYSFRFRSNLPASIRETAKEGHIWLIRLAGRGEYRFEIVVDRPLSPNPSLVARKIPDATPGLITRYSLSDEQALLAKVRYNRLIDLFTGITCYSLQSHLRTAVKKIGQIETDEIYVGVDKFGVQYVIPVQAKGGKDKLGATQTEQDIALCAEKFPEAVCIPISAQFMKDDVIALFRLELDANGVAIADERHYRLAAEDQISSEELTRYRSSLR